MKFLHLRIILHIRRPSEDAFYLAQGRRPHPGLSAILWANAVLHCRTPRPLFRGEICIAVRSGLTSYQPLAITHWQSTARRAIGERGQYGRGPGVLCRLLLMLTWAGCTVYRSYHHTSCSDTGNDVQHVLLVLLDHLSYRRPLIWRCRCFFHLKHAPPFGVAFSSSILNTPPRLAIPVQDIS